MLSNSTLGFIMTINGIDLVDYDLLNKEATWFFYLHNAHALLHAFYANRKIRIHAINS